MSYWWLLLLAVVSYGFKAFGLVVIGGRTLSGHAADLARLLPAALLSALIAVGVLTTDTSLTLDARFVGIVFAGFATWRKWPFTVIVIGAAAVTAAVRLVGS
ncbi:MAG: AzlD domain-containing protein [Microthrixaceae bacterium]